MGSNLFFCLPVCRNLFLRTLTHFPSNFSSLAENNVTNANCTRNAPSQNLFLHFITNRLNISSSDAAKILKKKPSLERLKTLDNVEGVVDMLSRHGFSGYQIANIFRLMPSVLISNCERGLEPKIQLLKDLGLEVEVIAKFPKMLGHKLESLRSNLELLKTVFPTQNNLIRAISSGCYIFGNNLNVAFKPSLAFWEDFGFRGTELNKFLSFNPFVLQRSSLTPKQRDFIHKIGMHKENGNYKYIVGIVAVSPIEMLEARLHNLEVCGLSTEEALKIVRADPVVLRTTEQTIKKKMDFMFNQMNLSVDFVVKHPRMFSMNLDKVMMPRFSVLQNRRAMDGAGEFKPTRLFTMLQWTENKFVGQIIEGHPESATLWTVYKSATAKLSKA